MTAFHSVQGFYSVYREIFAKVAAEDTPYMDKEEEAMPAFGEAMYSTYRVYVARLVNAGRVSRVSAVQTQHSLEHAAMFIC